MRHLLAEALGVLLHAGIVPSLSGSGLVGQLCSSFLSSCSSLGLLGLQVISDQSQLAVLALTATLGCILYSSCQACTLLADLSCPLG